MIIHWLEATWNVLAISAPWLLAGFFFSGVIHLLLPAQFIKRELSTRGIGSVVKAAAVGIPLPLCSCSVIPVGVSLRREGATRGATASFCITTPEIGVDSFLLSYVLLGPLLAVVRVITAFISAVTTGFAIDLTDNAPQHQEATPAPAQCCSTDTTSEEKVPQGALSKLKKIFHFGFGSIFDDLSSPLTIGLLGAGFIAAIVPDTLFSNLNASPLLSMCIMLAASLPMYVCATSSTPLAAALIAKGLNPGAALVFLLAGPATNVATILVLKKELGRKALTIYLTGLTTLSLTAGAMTNLLLKDSTTLTPHLLEPHTTEHALHAVHYVGGYVLLILLVGSLFRRTKS